MYIDLTNVNKVYLKDSYLLLNIDKLVNSTTGHPTLSFMDAFSSYH